MNDGLLDEDLVGVTETSDPLSAGVVLLGGAGQSVGYRELDTVFKLAQDGVPVVALHRNALSDLARAALDMGAFMSLWRQRLGSRYPC